MKKGLGLILILFLISSVGYGQEIVHEDFFPHEEMPEWLVGEKIVQIAMRGNLRVSEEEILAVIKTTKGEPFSRRRLRDDVKKIYGLRFFQDVQVDAEQEWGGGLRLTFLLKEKPTVSQINFTGNKKIKSDELLENLTLKEGDFFDGIKQMEAVEGLVRLYKDKGYYWVSVKVDQGLDETTNEVKLDFRIQEGKIVKIKRINFIGNKAISSLRLSWHMETKRRGHYKEEELADDIERLHLLYGNKGYILAQISPEVVYDEKMKGFIINIYIDEREQFKVGKITFVGNTLFTASELTKPLRSKPTKIYSLEEFRQDIERIKSLYFEEGYIEARVIPDPSLDRAIKKIDIVLRIEEGRKYYLEGIEISGNVVTREKVIRREFLIKPGEVFDGKKVALSRQRIFNLGYFDEVDMEQLPGSAPNKKILSIQVKERKTGMATLGAGYSSRDGLVGNIDVGQTNLFGRGWKAKLSTSFGGKVIRYNFGFRNPWLFDTPTSFGFGLYDTRRDAATYLETRRGGNVSLGYRLGPFNHISLAHKREDVFISNVTEDAPRDIEHGVKATKSLINSLVRDTRDIPIDPTRGYRAELTNEFAGGFLGGHVDFYKPNVDLALHIPVFWKLVFSLHGRWGIVASPVGDEGVPDYERFYLGGANSVRGYRDLSIHPIDADGNDIGGEGMFLSNIELGFPLVEHTLRTGIFFDAGNAWLKPEDINLGDLKTGAGLGILFHSPMGPVRLDYGYPIGDPDHTEPQFHFGIGSIF